MLVGGCLAQPATNPEFWDPATTPLRPNPLSLVFARYEVAPVTAVFAYTPGERHSPTNVSWPPPGLHLTVHFAPPSTFPSNASSSFIGPVSGLAFDCPAAGCINGYATCDNTTVGGQCSWPRASAVAECAKWSSCIGLNCNPSRSDCQARGAPFSFAVGQYDVYYRGGAQLAPNTSVAVHYEMYDGLPVIHKYVTVSQSSGAAVVDDVFIELLRAPNFGPEAITVFQLQPSNPTPYSQQVVPQSSFWPGRTQQIWFFDDEWDACCDRELHVPYSYYTALKVGYGPDVAYGGLTGPGALVTPASPFTSISVRLLFHDTTELERQGLGVRRMHARLTPQLMETPLYYMITDISTTAAFRLAIDQAAAAGFEMVVIGYGAAGWCGMCPEQLTNATWVAWFKTQVDYGRGVGIGVSGELEWERGKGRGRYGVRERMLSVNEMFVVVVVVVVVVVLEMMVERLSVVDSLLTLMQPPPLPPPPPITQPILSCSTTGGGSPSRNRSRSLTAMARGAALRASPRTGTRRTACPCSISPPRLACTAWKLTGSTREPHARTPAVTTTTTALQAAGTPRCRRPRSSTSRSRRGLCTKRAPTRTASVAPINGTWLTRMRGK